LDDLFSTTRSGEEVEAELVFPVWFGTNRQPIDPADSTKGFSHHRAGTIRYGRVNVSIPESHRFGETGTPWWKRWWRLEFSSDHLRVQEELNLTSEEFCRELRTAIEIGAGEFGTAQALVFLHGFNTGFEDAAIRAAQLGHDLKVPGPTAFFSWPSRGTLRGYPSDAATIAASEEEIATFLTRFVRDCGTAKVHLIAHSMGNRGLLRALQRIAADAEASAGVHFGQIFLAAPDVDRDLFLSLARLYPAFSERTTLYASERDKALWTSRWLYEAPRAGFLPPVTVSRHIDTIEVPGFNSDLLGHNAFATVDALLHDISDLMSQNRVPGLRQRLQRRESDVGTYWRFAR